MAKQTLSPQAWRRYWVIGGILGVAILIFGIASRDAQVAFVGGMMIVLTPAMLAFWREAERRKRQGPQST